MYSIPLSDLALVTGGAARYNTRVTAGRDELKQAVTTVSEAVKDVAAARQNNSSSSMLPMVMMMAMKNRG